MTTENINGFDIVGLSITTTTEIAKNAEAFEHLWNRFFTEEIPSKITDKIGDEIICVYDNFIEITPDVYEVRATVGCKVKTTTNLPAAMTLATVNKGTYQHLPTKGKMPACIVDQWESIWREKGKINRKFDTDFEVYGPKAFDKENGQMDIYLSIKA